MSGIMREEIRIPDQAGSERVSDEGQQALDAYREWRRSHPVLRFYPTRQARTVHDVLALIREEPAVEDE
jgi:hypothetical protein